MEKKILAKTKIALLLVIFIKSTLVFGASLSNPIISAERLNTPEKLHLDKVNNIATSFNVDATLEVTAATCANNGSITATATGSTTTPSLYVFKITSGPTANGQTYPTPDQIEESSFTFDDLYAGIYEITIEDSGDPSNPIFVGNVTVNDETELLDFTASSNPPVCANERTGSLTVTTTSGVGPYQYQIINGPSGTVSGPVDSANPEHTFNNLPSGNYRLRVTDGCGDFQSRNHRIEVTNFTNVFLFDRGINRISCSEATYSVGAFGGDTGSLTYEIVGGAPAGYESTNTTGSFTLPYDQAPYTVSVMGDCGSTDTYTHNNPIPSAQLLQRQRNCNNFGLRIRTFNLVEPITYTLNSTPPGYTGPLTNTTGSFDDLPYGDFSYTVTDSCGTVVTGSRTIEIEPIEITRTSVSAASCTSDIGRLVISRNSEAIAPITYELTTVPSSFTGNAGPQNNSNVFENITVGNYVLMATDACGNTDTQPFEYIDEDAIDLDFDISVLQGCIGEHDVVFTTNESQLSGFWFYHLINVETGMNVASTGRTSGRPTTFFDISEGEYYIQYNNNRGCTLDSDPFIVEPYQQPRLTPLSSYVCTDESFVTISGVTEGGAGPYTYRLIDNANNQIIESSNDLYFPNQNPSRSYRVRIEDNCGNSSSAQVTPLAVGLGLEFEGETCAEIGEPFTISVQFYTGFDYEWTFPDGSTFNGNDPSSTIGLITSSDYGTYTVVASTQDGCRTQTLNLDFDQCPPPSIDFDGVDDYISAPSSFNLNDMEELTIQFWVKANSASQVSAGIVGQRDVLEISKDISLGYNFAGQGRSGAFSNTEWLDDADTWQHISIVYNSGEIKTYYNGHLDHVESGAGVTRTASSNSLFNIGGRTGVVDGSDYFHGWIDEVRVFDKALTDTQIQQIVYQEIENNNGNVRGAVIPKDIKDFNTDEPLLWSSLKLYYKMGTTFTADEKVIDYSGNENHGTIFNIRTWQEETAPMPYVTSQHGNWEDTSTWLHGDVWDIASGNVFPNSTRTNFIRSSIVKISHNITLNHNVEGVTQMGLIVDNGNTLTVTGDKFIENLSYLDLSGTIDLFGDSQLIQKEKSDLVTSSQGKILRRQEGTSSAYWYNYWTSPVGTLRATSYRDNNTSFDNPNNSPFNLHMLKDDSGLNCQFTSEYTANGNISTFWLYTYINGLSYYDWAQIAINTNITPGVGYTQKGTGVPLPNQQYIFEGKPNNGTILVDVEDIGGAGSVAGSSKTEFLLGNPYASAIDVHKFIDDNAGIIDGTLQLWQQWSGTSHNLDAYNGGYAQINKTGAVRASQFIGLLGATTEGLEGTKIPTRYLPVGQGFITEIVATGSVEFNNSQRIFVKEADANGSYQNGSVFFKGNNKGKSTASRPTEVETNSMQRIRLEFSSVTGPDTKRELLLGFSEKTTDGYDYGYDAETHDISNNDLSLNSEGKNMNIQAYSPITPDKVVPLNFRSSGEHTFEIKVSAFENMEDNQEVYVLDNLTGTYFNLNTNQPYRFTSNQGVFNERLALVFQQEAATLSTEENIVEENYIYHDKSSNRLFVKKLKGAVTKFRLYNITGQNVMELTDVDRTVLENGLQLPTMSTGTYIAVFRTDTNNVITQKIIMN